MLPRKIIHLDMDCFYAAVELRERPELQGRPVAVGGKASSRGVLTTANYQARRFGVKSAMPTALAQRLCPGLVLIRPRFSLYKKVSRNIHAILANYSETIEPLSLDEAYLDVSRSSLFQGSATVLAQTIRDEIWQKEKLRASAGIAPNKFLAKVASDWNKPNGQLTIAPEEINAFVAQLNAARIPGIGPVSLKKLQARGIQSCADLQKLGPPELQALFGRWGGELYHLARGRDERPVRPSRQSKSLSVENTFSQDLVTEEAISAGIEKIYDELAFRLSAKARERPLKGLFAKIKFNDFTQTTADAPCTALPSFATFRSLALQAQQRSGLPVRLIGLGVRFATPAQTAGQLPLFGADNA